MRFLIIGGSDAGISAALRGQELDPEAEILVLLQDDYPNFSICEHHGGPCRSIPAFLITPSPCVVIEICSPATGHQHQVSATDQNRGSAIREQSL